MIARLRSALAATLIALLAAGCAATGSSGPTGLLTVSAVAGPVCPVERVPPDPACAPRPVAAKDVAVITADGSQQVVVGRTDAAGKVRFALPFGRYVVRGRSNGGFPIPPEDTAVEVGARPVDVTLNYDTGIR